MAFFNGNTPYLTINGVDVAPMWAEIEIKRSGNTTEVTAGAGATDTMREAGLNDTSLKIKLGYKVESIPTYMDLLDANTEIDVVYGPEGAVSGKRKHQQTFLITSSPLKQTIKKDEVAFEIDCTAKDAPVINMWAGGVWS